MDRQEQDSQGAKIENLTTKCCQSDKDRKGKGSKVWNAWRAAIVTGYALEAYAYAVCTGKLVFELY